MDDAEIRTILNHAAAGGLVLIERTTLPGGGADPIILHGGTGLPTEPYLIRYTHHNSPQLLSDLTATVILEQTEGAAVTLYD